MSAGSRSTIDRREAQLTVTWTPTRDELSELHPSINWRTLTEPQAACLYRVKLLGTAPADVAVRFKTSKPNVTQHVRRAVRRAARSGLAAFCATTATRPARGPREPREQEPGRQQPLYRDTPDFRRVLDRMEFLLELDVTMRERPDGAAPDPWATLAADADDDGDAGFTVTGPPPDAFDRWERAEMARRGVDPATWHANGDRYSEAADLDRFAEVVVA